jgi:protein tyrosine phosphatase (PTP) superfamily phosphohydrolase (DUF442 family)
MRHIVLLGCVLFAIRILAPDSARAAEAVNSGTHAVSTEQIHNYRRVDDQFITGGQPREDQIRAAAAEGFRRVINLATINPRYSLPDEDGLVRSLGMTYDHIPVDWEHPTDADFAAFEQVMQGVGDDKTLIHCAANFRVTAFYSLYAMKHLGWSQSKAEEFRSSIWKGSNYPVWEEFIRRTQAQLAPAR